MTLPPSEKSGWPWTASMPTLEETMPNGKPWPRVSIVTPSYNQVRFIEETIRSVLLQGYPNLEYIIMDGGSTDGSVEVIRKYAPWLAFWTSEPDDGQAHAIAKGWSRSSAEIIAYINSDDAFLPGAIQAAVIALYAHPESPAICGGELQIDGDGILIAEQRVRSAALLDLLSLRFIPQPSVFLRRSAFEQVGGFNHSIRTSFDFELWTRMLRLGEFKCIPEVLSATRWHSSTKTMTQRLGIASELQVIVQSALANHQEFRLSPIEREYVRARLGYVLVSIYLDNPSRHLREIIANFVLAVLFWPPIMPSITWLVLSNLIYRTILCYLRVFKHKDIEQLQAIRGRTGIHWSGWQSQCQIKSSP